MGVLLDTHALLFWMYEPARLGPRAFRTLLDREVALYWSVASSWEIAVKVGLGRLRLHAPPHEAIPGELERQGVTLLPIAHRHAFGVAALPAVHGDPFDRLLVSQALAEGLAMVTADPHIGAYGVTVIW